MNKKIREKIDILKKETDLMFPDAKTELYYENNFQLLIAIIMSAQTTDKQVNKVNKVFFQVFKTPSDWIKLWEEKISEYIKTISFYKTKAKNIYKTCSILENQEIPSTIEELKQLNWVWVKTAKVYLAIVEDAPYLWVDTHVHRVLNRVWIVKTKTAEETDKEAEKILTKKDLSRLHHSLIFFWRYFCTARKPKCSECPVRKVCDYGKG